MLDINSYYKHFSDKHIILFYSGGIGEGMLVDLMSLLETHLKRHEKNLKIRKKVISVVLELVQNIYLHMSSEGVSGSDYSNIIFAVTNEANTYGVYGGNFMSTAKVSGLKEKLDSVNEMDEEELIYEYRERLASTGRSESGGAGLGLMSMVRKSGQKVEFDFEKTPNKKFTFFSIQVNVSF